jgi:hypothetical protein
VTLRLLTLLAALAAVCSLASTASAADTRPRIAKAARTCASYTYAGFQHPAAAFGVSGRLSLVAQPNVAGGHIAAWIGVGGSGMGPNGSDAWVQAGISGFPDGHSELYYEYQLPGQKAPQYVSLGRVVAGSDHDFAVYERPSQPNAWRVTLDGAKVSPAIVLPGSHGAWRPIATTENWGGDTDACNRFSYDFSNLAIASQYGSNWQPFALTRPLQDAGLKLSSRSSGFAASTA